MRFPTWLQALRKPRLQVETETPTLQPGHQPTGPAAVTADVLTVHQSLQTSGSYGDSRERIRGGRWQVLCGCGQVLRYRGHPNNDVRIHALHQVQEIQAALAARGLRL